MDPDMIRPRKCKPCPPPPPPPPPLSPKKEVPPPPSHRENAAQPFQQDCCSHYGHLPFSPLEPPPLWPRHLPPQLSPPRHVRSYWNDDLDQLSRVRRVESLEMGYRLNFRDPFDDLYEDHTLRRHSTPRRALPPPPLVGHHHHGPPLVGRQHHGPLPLVGHHHHRPPPRLIGHHRQQTPLLLGHHHGPPTSYYSPPVDYEYQHDYYGCDTNNPNGCTTM
nr:E3 ubiquitin-protein ligase Hakai-like [Nicotiana tomentosiformis]